MSQQLFEAFVSALRPTSGTTGKGKEWLRATVPGNVYAVQSKDGKWTRKLVTYEKDGSVQASTLGFFLRTFRGNLVASFEVGGKTFEVQLPVVVEEPQRPSSNIEI